MTKEELKERLEAIEYKLNFAIEAKHSYDITELSIEKNRLKYQLEKLDK